MTVAGGGRVCRTGESPEVGTGFQGVGRRQRARVPGAPKFVGTRPRPRSLKFVERLDKRWQVLDEERTKEASLLGEAKQRVELLRSELAAKSPVHKATNLSVPGVERLQRTSGRVESTGGENYRVCPPKMRTVSAMLSSAEDLASWQEDPQRDVQDAIRFGLRNAVLEIPTQKRGCTR